MHLVDNFCPRVEPFLFVELLLARFLAFCVRLKSIDLEFWMRSTIHRDNDSDSLAVFIIERINRVRRPTEVPRT